ncbi:MAG: hypothetical protein V4671_07045 [Armatimonadota bacterium]
MKQELNPLVIIAVIVVFIGAGVGAFMYMTAPRTPAGVNYTPGVPPWMEKGQAKTGAPVAKGYNPR